MSAEVPRVGVVGFHWSEWLIKSPTFNVSGETAWLIVEVLPLWCLVFALTASLQLFLLKEEM